MTWNEAQAWEKSWWGDCINSHGEEEKQLVYAKKMGMRMFHNGKSPYNIDMQGKSVIDIGGGPTSLLLKCINLGAAIVVDPLSMPQWAIDRYAMANIVHMNMPAEDMHGSMQYQETYDESWLYNCLQHTQDPAKIIDNAKKISRLIRIFEWIDTPTNIGHPHSLTAKNLDSWLGGEGRVETIAESNCHGKCYFGIFPT